MATKKNSGSLLAVRIREKAVSGGRVESDRGSGVFVEGNPGILDIAHTTRRLESGQVGADEAGE